MMEDSLTAMYIDNSNRPRWPYDRWREVVEKSAQPENHIEEDKLVKNDSDATENRLKVTTKTETKSNEAQDGTEEKNERKLEEIPEPPMVQSAEDGIAHDTERDIRQTYCNKPMLCSGDSNELPSKETQTLAAMTEKVDLNDANVNVETKTEQKSVKCRKVYEVYEVDGRKEYVEIFSTEHDHYSHYLDDDISVSCPLNTLIEATTSPDVSKTEEAKQTKEALMGMLNATLEDLSKFKLFHGSYLLPVGSMAEHTKIGKVDEFDFGLILPTLAQEEFFTLISSYDKVVTDPDIIALTKEICPKGGAEDAINDLRGFLKCLWATKMMKHIPEGWEVLNPSGHAEITGSVAATFHLQRVADKAILDFDLCFWVPLDDVCLSKLRCSTMPHRTCLVDHCKDENGLLYLVVPLQDDYICLSINTHRFAMSVVEREALQKFGPDNVRLQCYRACKSLISALIPKFQKSTESGCAYCFNGIVSSYCMKNIVLYMASNHTDEKYWTKDKLPNRVLEAFEILTFCMKTNSCEISVFFIPNVLHIEPMFKYNSKENCVTNLYDRKSERSPISGVFPDLTRLKELYVDDPLSQKAIRDYEDFLYNTDWRFPEVICRVSELLLNLMEGDEEEKREMVDNQGWGLELLHLPEIDSDSDEETLDFL